MVLRLRQWHAFCTAHGTQLLPEGGFYARKEGILMDHGHLDRLARTMAAGVSRRSVLRRAAGSAMTSPLALVAIGAAAAQSNKDKDKDKKDKGNQGNQGGPGASGCRGAGHPCEGNQVCCEGLVCPEA